MNPARYHALRDRTLAAVDHVFAEAVYLSFLDQGAVDADRPAMEIEAVLRVGGGKETNPAGSTGRSWRSRIVAERGELHIDRTQHPGIVARVGDRVKALSRPGTPWFEVLAVDDRGMTRLVLQLGEV